MSDNFWGYLFIKIVFGLIGLLIEECFKKTYIISDPISVNNLSDLNFLRKFYMNNELENFIPNLDLNLHLEFNYLKLSKFYISEIDYSRIDDLLFFISVLSFFY